MSGRFTVPPWVHRDAFLAVIKPASPTHAQVDDEFSAVPADKWQLKTVTK